MKKVRIILIALVAFTLFGLAVGRSQAQGQDVVTAQVDRAALTTDDSLWLHVTVDNSAGNASQPIMPVLDGFQVLGSSSG